MANKKFLTIDEQIELLKNRGLIINNDEIAKEFLLNNNYYRISGYTLSKRNNDIFENVELQDIIEIYNFDLELRHILLKYIEKIEIRFKSIYAYEFAKKFGPIGHLDVSNFSDEEKYNKIKAKVTKQKKDKLPHEKYLKHFENQNIDIPIWAIVDVFTISDISKFYAITNKEVTDNIADNYNYTSNKKSLNLSKNIHSIAILRNTCAHWSRLYDHYFTHKPSLTKKDKEVLNINGKTTNYMLSSFILVMRRLLITNDYNNMIKEINNILVTYSNINLQYYGFPQNRI